jgi:hypothetical protein
MRTVTVTRTGRLGEESCPGGAPGPGSPYIVQACPNQGEDEGGPADPAWPVPGVIGGRFSGPKPMDGPIA